MTRWTEGIYETACYRLARGGELSRAKLAYLHAGTLDSDGRNAVLVTHGYTTGHHFVLPDSLAAEGSWSELVGPGRAIDTNRFFVVSSNALGSCYGSSGPASIDEAVSTQYSEAFPAVTFEDTIRLQYQLLRSLGVKHLHAVAGPSMGGIQALQWGVQFPDFVSRLVVAVSGLKSPAKRDGEREALARKIRALPAWRNGNPEAGAMIPWLVEQRVRTLRTYSMDDYLREQGISESEVDAQLQGLAAKWAEKFHPWSLVVLAQAIDEFGVMDKLSLIRSKVFLALCANDQIFPASEGPASVELLRSAGVDAQYFEIPSRYGHLASGLDWDKWEGPLRSFLD
ncbi:MAG: alpha/beta fold hydrolase [Ottowia sp.]|uniref:alpha/beta fold hydrolase n=1 Tax=Ottowia sp. TaxID=1898956 RepID=UPI003C7374DC